MGGERSSTTRMRLAGKICCFCGRYLDVTLWQPPGDREERSSQLEPSAEEFPGRSMLFPAHACGDHRLRVVLMAGSLAMSRGLPMAGSWAPAGRALMEDTGKLGKAAVLPITGTKNGDFLF